MSELTKQLACKTKKQDDPPTNAPTKEEIAKAVLDQLVPVINDINGKLHQHDLRFEAINKTLNELRKTQRQ